MPNIRVDSTNPIINGLAVTFRSPADCSQVTGLIVYYPEGNGTTSKEFKFVDAHGFDVGSGTISLFAENVLVKVVLDTDHGKAYVQNADTNAYLEGRFAELYEVKPKAGNILETLRTDMGDNWVLCNGDVVPEGMFPALREVLPYNTDWRRLPPGSEAYTVVRPMPVEGQWLFMKKNDKALLYDESTNTYTTITMPTIAVTTGYTMSRGIFGLTHDGEKYILGIAVKLTEEANSLNNTYYAYFYVSSDLENWIELLNYKISEYHDAYDMTYNGTSVIFIADYSDNNGYSRAKVYFLDIAAKKVTVDGSYYSSEYRLYFQPVPNPYWCVRANNGESTVVRKGTASGSVFSFSSNPKVAFFSDRFWIGYPGTRAYIADLTTETTTSFSWSKIATGAYSANLSTIVYDANAREWCLHLSEYVSGVSSYYKYWLAYISEDADPREASNYRVVEVNELPSGAGATQMTPNRTRFRNDSTTARYIQNPNIKCLPTHDGDTYKYIYASETTAEGGNGGGTGIGSMPRIEFTDDGAGNVTMEVNYGS